MLLNRELISMFGASMEKVGNSLPRSTSDRAFEKAKEHVKEELDKFNDLSKTIAPVKKDAEAAAKALEADVENSRKNHDAKQAEYGKLLAKANSNKRYQSDTKELEKVKMEVHGGPNAKTGNTGVGLFDEREGLRSKVGGLAGDERKRAEERIKELDERLDGKPDPVSGKMTGGLLDRERELQSSVDSVHLPLIRAKADAKETADILKAKEDELASTRDFIKKCDAIMAFDISGEKSDIANMVVSMAQATASEYSPSDQDKFRSYLWQLMGENQKWVKGVRKDKESELHVLDKLAEYAGDYRSKVSQSLNKDNILARGMYKLGTALNSKEVNHLYSYVLEGADKINLAALKSTLEEAVARSLFFDVMNKAADKAEKTGIMADMRDYLGNLKASDVDMRGFGFPSGAAGSGAKAGTGSVMDTANQFANKEAEEMAKRVVTTVVAEKYEKSLQDITNRIDGLTKDDRRNIKKLTAINAEVMGILAELKIASSLDGGRMFDDGELNYLGSLSRAMNNAVTKKAAELGIKSEPVKVHATHTQAVERHIAELTGKTEAEVEDAIKANYHEFIGVMMSVYQFKGSEEDFLGGLASYMERQRAVYDARRRGAGSRSRETPDTLFGTGGIFRPSDRDGSPSTGYA